MSEYDVVVLGAGPVGENVADRAVKGGLTAALVEHALVGGECSYWACMPSKALLRPAQALRAARHVAGAAQAVTGELDVAAILKRRDSFTSDWKDDGQADWVRGAGISLVRGHGTGGGAAVGPARRHRRPRHRSSPTPRSRRSGSPSGPPARPGTTSASSTTRSATWPVRASATTGTPARPA